MLPHHPSLDDGDLAPFAAAALGLPEEPPIGRTGVGVVVPYDFALDRELWRWVPESATLHLTRTPYASLPVDLEQAETVSDAAAVAQCTTDLITVQPAAIVYACTSGSFVRGAAGERDLVAAMHASGAPAATSTSGALVEALRLLGVARVAVATPYQDGITGRLAAFLAEAGVEVAGTAQLGLSGLIWTVPYSTTVALIREAVQQGDCDAVFVSCTNLPTYDLIAPLEQELGVPVLTANQVTLWAALRLAGIGAVDAQQRLLVDPATRVAA